jgi:hypothetical protein
MNGLLLASAKSGKRKSGQKDLINYLSGKRLTQRQAIRAHCYDCLGMGEQDACESEECPLLPFSPYKASHVRFGERGGEKVARTELNAGNATFIGAIAPKNASTKAVEE